MKIQTENGQNCLETAQRMLFFYNRPREKRACITCSDDFVLYIGTAEGTCIRNSADFRLQEEQKDCTIIRRYSDGELSVIVTYTAEGNIFVKRVEIVSGMPLDLKKVCLLSGRSSLPLSRGGEGQPIFFGDMFWGGIEYPVANNTYEDGVVTCMQAPYEQTTHFRSLPVVFGFDCCGDLCKSFFSYIEDRSPAKGSLKVYGDWGLHDELSDTGSDLTEALTLENIPRIVELSKCCGIDYYLMDAFWFEENGAYMSAKRSIFPNGFDRVVSEIERHGLKFGLWFDINFIHARMKGMEQYSTLLDSGALCFACDEVAQMMRKAFLYHIEHHHVKMLKLDFAYFECKNPAHGHSTQRTESKEKSVKNFLAIVAEIKQKYPDVIFLCYNGWTTDLKWIGNVARHEGLAISPYWAQYMDYIYCGDPRPSEIASPDFIDSLCYYTDAMIRNFREAGMPFASIDDHGTMLGNTATIYVQGKRPLRLGWLMNAMRGGMKMQLYGDLSELDTSDREYISYISSIYDTIVERGYRTEFVLGDARFGEVYGYHVHGADGGYVVVVNPTGARVSRCVEVCPCGTEARILVRNGELSNESVIASQDGVMVELAPYGYILFEWTAISDNDRMGKLWLCAGDALYITACHSLTLAFMDGKDPVRTPRGCPCGMEVTVNGHTVKTNVENDIWSGISWMYISLDGKQEVRLDYKDGAPISVKYEMRQEET